MKVVPSYLQADVGNSPLFILYRNGRIVRFYPKNRAAFKNLSYFKQDIFLIKRLTSTITPLRVFLEITQLCNLSCRFCYLGRNKIDEFVSFKGFSKIIRKIKRNTLEIVLTGGEPFLHPKLEEFIKLSSFNRLSVEINTNGSLPERIKNMRKVLKKNVRILQFSIHTLNKHLFKKIVDNNISFNYIERLVESVEITHKYRLPIRVNIVLTKHTSNYKNVIDILEFLSEKRNVLQVKLSVMVPTEKTTLNLFPSFSQVYNLVNKVRKIRRNYNFSIILPEDALRLTPTFCTAGISVAYISVTGDIYPCPYYTSPIGNIFKDNYLFIWKEWRKKFLTEKGICIKLFKNYW